VLAPARAGERALASAGERRPQRDLGNPGQCATDRAVRLRLLGELAKQRLVDAGDPSCVVSSILRIVGVPSTGRRVTAASVSIDSAGKPARARVLASAIEKQEAFRRPR
jgi:hypothetical protein